MTEESTLPKSFADCLYELEQDALERKSKADAPELARRWAVVRTELEKVYAYVNTYLKEE